MLFRTAASNDSRRLPPTAISIASWRRSDRVLSHLTVDPPTRPDPPTTRTFNARQRFGNARNDERRRAHDRREPQRIVSTARSSALVCRYSVSTSRWSPLLPCRASIKSTPWFALRRVVAFVASVSSMVSALAHAQSHDSSSSSCLRSGPHLDGLPQVGPPQSA